MKKILIGLFALLMLFASSTEWLAQKKKAPIKRATTTKKKTTPQKLSEPANKIVEQDQPSTQNPKPAQEESSATMEETINFIVGKVENRGAVEFTERFKPDIGTKTLYNYNYSKVYLETPCTFTFQRHDVSYTSDKDGNGNDITRPEGAVNFQRFYKFNLKEFDPLATEIKLYAENSWIKDRFTIDKEIWEVKLIASGNRYVVSEEFIRNDKFMKDYKGGGPGTSFYVSFLFYDKTEATRVAKALNHAITLCGGKVDPF